MAEKEATESVADNPSLESSSPKQHSSANLVLEDIAVEEYVEEEKEKKSRGRYHLLGGIFLVVGLIMAFLCILVSRLVLYNGVLDSDNTKYVFYFFWVAFFFMLWNCLCCTYWFGVNKAWNWERPKNLKIRFNMTNVLTFGGILIEFLQLLSFSFNSANSGTDPNFTLQYYGLDILKYLNHIAHPYYQGGPGFSVAFWILFCFSLLPYLLVIIVRILSNVVSRYKTSESEAAAFINAFQNHFHMVLWFLVTVLFFPVVTTMVAGIDCTFKGKDTPTLDSNPAIECLSIDHILIAVASIVGLVVYCPAATFAQSQTHSITDIKFKPRVVFLMILVKSIFPVVQIFSGYDAAYFAVVLVAQLLLLAVNLVFDPCLLPWVNHLRTALFASTAIATITSLIAFGHTTPADWWPLVLLCGALLLFIVLFPTMCYVHNKRTEKSKSEKTVRSLAEKFARKMNIVE